MAIHLKSPAFHHDHSIPTMYSGEGEDVSPRIEWTGLPTGTKSIALICDDPDAPRKSPFVHWLIFNIDPEQTALPEGLPAQGRLDQRVRAIQGMNSFGSLGYGGPMPPVGHGVHRYIFKLYALDLLLDLEPGAEKEDLLRAMEGHILDTAQLIGKYERKAQKQSA